MRCLYCHREAHEDLARCPECGFALQQVRELLGVSPALDPGVSDLQGVFTKREVRQLKSRLADFERKFPQSTFSVVTSEHPSPSLPFSIFAFWLFNTSGICKKLNTGGNNHDLLLTLDAPRGVACLTAGYGLEPFVGQEPLSFIVEQAKKEFESGAWLAGALTIIDQAEKTLAEICSNLNRTYGISTQKIYEDEKRRSGDLIQKGDY
jgi:uncharacterized membrane protein YgcG